LKPFHQFNADIEYLQGGTATEIYADAEKSIFHNLARLRILSNNELREGALMKGIVEERAVKLGEYIIENKATVRAAAGKFGVSKSTVHKDVAQRLKYIDPQLYRKVKVILEYNKEQRHIRGGIATKLKYQRDAERRAAAGKNESA
jgi:putative DeoR family transcriptional regulator (stage III sporulation protein D)